jgi:hypothetical protein
MKWVTFANDFIGNNAPLKRFLKTGDELEKIKKAPVHTVEPGILVSAKYDDIMDSCFRIYTIDRDSFEQEYIHGEAALKKEETLKKEKASNINLASYHKWHYERGLPRRYFDPTYFDERFIDDHKIGFTKLNQDDIDNTEGKDENEKANIYFSKKYGTEKYPRPHPYEIYVGGWVNFFDEEVRGGDSDHAVYFQWHLIERAVTVYILQTKIVTGWNVNVNVNITNPPASTDPPPPPPHQPPC